MNSSDEGTKLAAYAVYSQRVELEHVAETLNEAGFSNEEICLLLAPAHPLARLVRDMRLLSTEVNHAAASGLMTWLLQFGAVVIPQVGFFVRSRDFLHSLMVEPRTSSCSGTKGALLNLHIPDRDAERFGALMSDTGGFVYVSCEKEAQTQWAREILRTTGAKEVRCLQESSQQDQQSLPRCGNTVHRPSPLFARMA